MNYYGRLREGGPAFGNALYCVSLGLRDSPRLIDCLFVSHMHLLCKPSGQQNLLMGSGHTTIQNFCIGRYNADYELVRFVMGTRL